MRHRHLKTYVMTYFTRIDTFEHFGLFVLVYHRKLHGQARAGLSPDGKVAGIRADAGGSSLDRKGAMTTVRERTDHGTNRVCTVASARRRLC
jgi:hypothetical protein